ncbi:MAG: hypothetical protein PHW15_02210 [Patescibacteria group bacterium]|jgi:hypothetical protein|nr:hypothetical protein [Patescibacteria group bacterium]MDD5172806.1 hypothetical protein [Patescibacteria group bacterium]
MKTSKTIIFFSLITITIFLTGCSQEKNNVVNLQKTTDNTSQTGEATTNQEKITRINNTESVHEEKDEIEELSKKYDNWNVVENREHGFIFKFPKEWVGLYEGPYIPEDFDVNAYNHFLLSLKNRINKSCLNIRVDVNPWPFKKDGTQEKDYCNPSQTEIFEKCIDKIIGFKGDTYFGEIISDYSIQIPFKNRIIESKRKGNGSYYYKHAFVNVNNRVLSFTLVGDSQAQDDSECQNFIKTMDVIVESVSTQN